MKGTLEMGQIRYAKKLIAALHHKRPEKRREVVWVLGEKREGKAVGPLIKVLEKDSDLHVRAAAAEALGKIADGRALEPLIRALSSPYLLVRGRAAEALGSIGSAKALPHLYASMSKDHAFVRRHAEKAIQKIEAGEIEG